MTHSARKRGRPSIYPWDRWLDGHTKTLRPGEDYPVDRRTESLRGAILQEARKRNLRVYTETVSTGGISIIFPPKISPESFDKILDGQPHTLKFGKNYFVPTRVIYDSVAEEAFQRDVIIYLEAAPLSLYVSPLPQPKES